MEHRLERLRNRIPEKCRDWPLDRILTEGEPEPPSSCVEGARVYTGLTLVYVLGIDSADI